MAPRRLLPFLFSVALGAAGVLAQADYTCSSDASCPQWYNASDHNISANSTCVADPLNPQYGYCGFVGATCETANDCDFGQCVNNQCYGYYGSKCASNNDCLGTLQCGSDGMCGGKGGACPNGNTDCASQSCTAGICDAVPSSGMAKGSGCQTGDICSSGSCSSAYTCQTKVSAANGDSTAPPPPGISAGARHRTRRDQRSHGRPRMTTLKRRCPSTLQTACLMGISSGSGAAFECVDTTTSLESCGGCMPVPGSNETQYSDPDAPAGIDCTSLPNVEDVVCRDSRCKILACRPGASLNPDGTACSLII